MKTNKIKVDLSLNKRNVVDLENDEIAGMAGFTTMGSLRSLFNTANCGVTPFQSACAVKVSRNVDGDNDAEQNLGCD